jgi:competence ComEA-like helix-hairpin-helix protein
MKKPFVIFSKRMERGAILWLCVCTLVIFLPRLVAYFFPAEISYTWTYEEQQQFEKTSFENSVKSKGRAPAQFQQLWKRSNPESLSKEEWIRLGLSPKQATSLLRYRDKYGLNSLQQMRRIRVLPGALLDQIADSLIFAHAKEAKANLHVEASQDQLQIQVKTERKIDKLDLNSATTAMLVALPGVGQYTAEKIINYRERLGGFISLSQLNEIKGLTPELLENALKYMTIESEAQKMNLNLVSYERLKQHPYLTWNQANSLLKMRAQKGTFHALQEIKESVLIDDETYKKLLPYVSL